MRYPIFIVSKGRWKRELCLTPVALELLGINDYRVIVEEEEFKQYADLLGWERLIVLPPEYKTNYDLCDPHGLKKSTGPGPARNFVWDMAKRTNYKRHWVMDDNLHDFHRLHENVKCPVRTDACFRAMEDFVDRFTNVPVAGPNYYSMVKKTDAVPPFVANTRIYSCLLIENDAPYRWRGRYNEDTDLSLRVLKDGLCTIQFNAFLCGKVTTQRMRGGNTKEFYADEGTKAKSEMLAAMHPEHATVVWRFNRWHHHVDYRPFRHQHLIPVDPDAVYPPYDNYGMWQGICDVPRRKETRADALRCKEEQMVCNHN